MKKILLKLFIFYRLYLIICFYHFKNNSLFLINDNENIIVVNIKIDSTSNSYGYSDVTKEWQKDIYHKSGIVDNQDYFIDKNGEKYVVDNKNVLLDYTESEYSIAKFYAETKKKDVSMLPRVLEPKSVKTADFVEKTTGTFWEIKEPIGNTADTTMLNQFKGQQEKAHNFIIDIHLSEINNQFAIEEIEKIYQSKRYDWVDEVVLLRGKKIIKVFKTKKMNLWSKPKGFRYKFIYVNLHLHISIFYVKCQILCVVVGLILILCYL